MSIKTRLLRELLLRAEQRQHTLILTASCTEAVQLARLQLRVFSHFIPLGEAEALQIARIWWEAQMPRESTWKPERFLRAPHHTASDRSMFSPHRCRQCKRTTYGSEIDLAYGGVLFLTDVDEFRRSTLAAIAPYYRGDNDQYPRGLLVCSSMADRVTLVKRVPAVMLDIPEPLLYSPADINDAIIEMDRIEGRML